MFTDIPVGGRFPRDVHLFVQRGFRKSTVRGGLVDGPVVRSIFGSLKGVTIREPDPLAAFQDERAVYHDDIQRLLDERADDGWHCVGDFDVGRDGWR